MEQNETGTINPKKQKCDIADWAIVMAVPSNAEPLTRYKVARDDRREFESTFEELLLKGCDRKALITALWIANTIKVAPLPTTGRVKVVAKKMRELARAILELERTQFHILQQREVVSRSGLGPEEVGDLSLTFPQFALPKWLQKGAEIYDDWLRMAKNKVPPRRELLLRVRRVCPVIYVKWATGGRPFCDRVATLLSLAGIAKISKEQLSREALAFEADYRFAAAHIRTNLALVHQRVLTYHAVNRNQFKRV